MAIIDLVLVTYNRLGYTRKTVERLLSDPDESFRLTIWDNASDDGTREYLHREVSDPRIVDLVLSKDNVGQAAAVNTIWAKSDADLLGKLDNDCLLTPGWTRTLARAHEDLPELGTIACWHYFLDDFDLERARHKIQRFGEHQILRHPFTPGTGLLFKREWFERFGPIQGKATTQFWLRMSLAGLINGFYYPLIHQEHMDDPKSEHSTLKDEAAYQAAKAVTFNINNHGQETLADRWRWRQEVLDDLLDGPWQANQRVGWRRRLRVIKNRIQALKTSQ